MRFLTILFIVITVNFAGVDVFYVDVVNTNGNGTPGSPFNNIAAGLTAAQPGDTVFVKPGTYTSQITTVRDGAAGNRITLKAFAPGARPLVTRAGRVTEINKVYFTIDGFIIDGQFGDSDIIRVRNTGSHLQILNCEVRNSIRDGIDISSADSVLIQGCRVHHTLAGTFTTQADAHGIVATGQNHLVIRDCEVYYISGDCFQTDPNRNTSTTQPAPSIIN